MSEPSPTEHLARLVRSGDRIALADGAGSPVELIPALAEIAARRGDVSLLLGWSPPSVTADSLTGFADVRAVMSGWGLRHGIDSGRIMSVPCRMSAVPSLLRETMRPDLLVARLVRRHDGLHFGTESSWMRGLVDDGIPVAALISRHGACADAGPPLPESSVVIVGESDDPPFEVHPQVPGDVEQAIARHTVAMIPAGARVQVAPGRLGAALLGAIDVPVAIDSGLLPDSVVDLDERGLLLGTPTATYLAGSRRLYEWADGKPILHPIEWTHDSTRLGTGAPFIAFNTAIEIDLDGQVNAEGTGTSTVGGVGGHPDYAGAAARAPRGLSIIGLASTHAGRSTLVRRLARPATTPSHDVDIVVNEHGSVDLRGMTRAERARAISDLWDGSDQ